jgi:hypothetical protein
VDQEDRLLQSKLVLLLVLAEGMQGEHDLSPFFICVEIDWENEPFINFSPFVVTLTSNRVCCGDAFLKGKHCYHFLGANMFLSMKIIVTLTISSVSANSKIIELQFRVLVDGLSRSMRI